MRYDAIVVGNDGNGLSCATSLAQNGLSVLVIGASHTEMLQTPRIDMVEHDTTLIRPALLEQLSGRVAFVDDAPLLFAPLSGIAIWQDVERTVDGLGMVSAEAYTQFLNFLQPYLKTLDQLNTNPAPDITEITPHQYDLFQLMSLSCEELLSRWFTDPALMGVLASRGIRGSALGPYQRHTVGMMLQHMLGEQKQVVGGVGAVMSALEMVARENGVVFYEDEVVEKRSRKGAKAQSYQREIQSEDAIVKEIVIDGEQAVGVRLLDGTEISADTIVSSYDPRTTCLQLVKPYEWLLPRFVHAIRHFRQNGTVAKLNLTLNRLPDFGVDDVRLLQGKIVVAPSMTYLEQASDAAKYGRIAEKPYLEITIPTLATTITGEHAMSVWMQYAPYYLKGDWDAERERLLTIILDTLATIAPDIRETISAYNLLTPLDLERQYKLSEGAIYQGEMTLDQLLYMRPAPDWSRYATPIKGLYLCGAGTHPGGGLTGENGRLAAQQILERV